MKKYIVVSLALSTLLVSAVPLFAMLPDPTLDGIEEVGSRQYLIKQQTKVGERTYYWESDPIHFDFGLDHLQSIQRTSETLDKRLCVNCEIVEKGGLSFYDPPPT